MQYVDISDRKRFEGQLRRLADTDALTGLYNRRRFGDELEWIVGYAHRYGHPAALLAIDVDHFQYINDSYGHATGDELLGTVTALLRSRLRETDIVGRLGGDEFGVILPQTALEDAESIGQALIEAAREQVYVVRDGRKVRATLSIGIRAIEPEAELTPAEQLAESEIARNEAKERGRDRFAVSGRDVHGSARSRRADVGRAPARGARERRLRALRAADPRPRGRSRGPLGAADPDARRRRRDHPPRRVPGRGRALRADQGDRPLGDRPRDPPARRAPRVRPRAARGSTSTSRASRSPTRR